MSDALFILTNRVIELEDEVKRLREENHQQWRQKQDLQEKYLE